jgi:hypothetical protein
LKRLARIIIILGTIFLVGIPLSAAAKNNCLGCHSEWEDGESAPTKRWPYDVHNQADLTCVDCHGGDPGLEDMDAVRSSRGYRGVPKTAQIPGFCGRCHSDAAYMKKFNPSLPVDQVVKYKTSRHGQLLEKGDTMVATCISCHSVHDIGKAGSPRSSTYHMNIPKLCASCHSDPVHMAGYGIPTDQYEKYASSVHGVALLEHEDAGAPACNDCHGNHGAIPPGVEDISSVCGLCHAKVAGLFDKSPHKAAFEMNDFPQCETCHSNHAIVKPRDVMIGTGPQSLCIECHSKDDGTKGYVTAATVSILLDSLVHLEDTATEVINEAESKGMLVEDERFALKDVHSSLITSRTLVHTFDLTKIQPELDKGIKLAVATEGRGLQIIGDYYFRRKGLVVASIFITLLAILIWMKIRRLEKHQKK